MHDEHHEHDEQSTREAAGDGPFRVLCVCEGNIARSPVAALLLQTGLGPDVEVTSAGTRAVVGAPLVAPMVTLLADRVAGTGTFRARQLRADLVRGADLVLTMTRRQRGRVVELAPAVVRRTFTLRELARLLADVDPQDLSVGTLVDRLRQVVPAAAAQRRYVADPRTDDIADPYGRDDEAYRRAFSEIVDAVDVVARAVAPDGPETAGPRRGTGGQSTAGSASRAGTP
jgi:protein-tyrosine phosphatase